MRFKTTQDLALFSINYFLTTRQIPVIAKEDVDPSLLAKGASFVSCYIDGKLRGCVGDYLSFEPLFENIVKNAIHASTQNCRFEPIKIEEFEKFTVEVTLLSPLQELKAKDENELLQFLQKEKPGILLENRGKRALFLPQVWEKIPDPKEFLIHLCLKAGLPENSWQEKSTRLWYFTKLS